MLARWAQFCKDCYIMSTCTPSCPATGTAWLWGLAQAGAWLCYPMRWLSKYNKEWDIAVIQPISSISTSELFRKALVDIWIDLYLIKFQFLAILCVFSCDQAALWMVQSICLSVHPSVRPSFRHTFLTMFPSWYHHEIFSGVVTNDKSDVHAKVQGQRSKVKVTEVNSQLSRFRTVTPVWIQISWWNDAQSLVLLRRGALLFFKVIRQISRSHSSKNRQIWPKLGVSELTQIWIHQWPPNDAQSLK